jgi:A/G-specific adenine glycosylase
VIPRPAGDHAALRRSLLRFYDRSARTLPWRGTRDPYAVLVSEVMLQQTQVKTVLRYFDAWMRRFPTLGALAAADEADVLHAWQGLGYYSRARRLQQAARAVVDRHGGRMPSTREELLALPGIGEYSAGAVSSIAFGLPEPLVDGNVVRVLTRLFGLRGDPGRAPLKARLWALARELVSGKRPGDFNQALMELGATVCTPRTPRCAECPVARACVAREKGLASRLPELPERRAATEVRSVAVVVRSGSRVLLRRVPDDAARWAGLFTFPFVELRDGEAPSRGAERAAREVGLRITPGERVDVVRHTITRFRITLEVLEATSHRGTPRAGARFVDAKGFAELAMPAPHRKLAPLASRPSRRS